LPHTGVRRSWKKENISSKFGAHSRVKEHQLKAKSKLIRSNFDRFVVDLKSLKDLTN
jgi:hypothetical protein